MATDGVKIIDGDLAFDLYSRFMELYDEDISIDELMQKYEDDKQSNYYDDEEFEICVTVYALAFWEIGKLNQHIIEDVKNVIDKKATVEGWKLEVGEKMARKRERELEKFWLKINVPKEKPRKSKKYKKITEFLFQKGDILAFQCPNGKYGISIVTNIIQEKGDCIYALGYSVYMSERIPEMKKIEEIEFIGFLSGICVSPHLDELGLKHNDASKNSHKIQIIGNVKLKKKVTIGGYVEGLKYEQFCAEFPFDESKKTGFRSIFKFKLKEFIAH